MKALQVTAPGHAQFIDVPKPTPQPGEALIKPLVLSLCGSDIYMYKYLEPEEYPLEAGSSGHEMVGIIEEINGNYDRAAVGDAALVIAPPQFAMSEYYITPFKHIIPVPAGMPPEHAVQAQQLGTVIYATKALPNMVGKSAVVIGQGSAGQWWNFMLNRLGASHVIGIDLHAHRLTHSQHFGATHTVHNAATNPLPQIKTILSGKQPDLAVIAASEVEAINLAIDVVREDGFVFQFGVPHAEKLTIDYNHMFRKCLTLKSVVFASREPGHRSTVNAIEMISSGVIDVSPLITHRFPFDQVLDAYALQESRRDGAIKIIVEMGKGLIKQ
ncbi:MAG: zinc-binding dehydrogenase [Chloroflexota bacterium]